MPHEVSKTLRGERRFKSAKGSGEHRKLQNTRRPIYQKQVNKENDLLFLYISIVLGTLSRNRDSERL